MLDPDSAERQKASVHGGPMRLVVQEPCLAKYRVPVYRELASRAGVQLKVVYGTLPNLPNVEPDGFDGELTPLGIRHLGRHVVYWHAAPLKYATRRAADVLILQWDVHYASLIPTMLKARAQGVPTILWGHGYSKRESATRSAIRNSVARLATALLLYTPGVAARFVEQGWPADRVYVAINSLDQGPINAARDRWLGDEDGLAAFRRQHDFHGQPVLLYVSRLDPENRLDMAIQALERLKTRYPSLELVVIGKGQDERDRLDQLARQLDVQARVRFVGAIYEEHALAPWFLSANLFCYPANIGLSLLHAFGYGLPVVTTNRVEAQNPEIEALRHGVNGLLYEDGSVDSLAQSISSLLDNEALARRMGEAARDTVVHTFSLERMVDGIVAAAAYCCRRQERTGI